MVTINLLIQQIVNGVFFGLIFGMIALGLSIIWGVSRIINVAHGEFIIVGAYITIVFYNVFNVNPSKFDLYSMVMMFIIIILSGLVVAFVGVLIQYFLYARIKGDISLNSLIISFGIAVLLTALLVLFFTGDFKAPVGGSNALSLKSIKIGGFLLVKYGYLFAGLIAIIVFLGAYLFLEKTDVGRAIRAVAQDSEVAPLMGIDNKKIYLLAMLLSAFIAGVAGSVAATLYTTTPFMGNSYLGWSFAITVLAGLGNIQGILISGILIGIARALTSSFYPGLESSVGFFIMIIVILFRPRGLFGKVTE